GGSSDEYGRAPADELRKRAADRDHHQRDDEDELHAHRTCDGATFFHRIAAVNVGVVGLGTMGAGIAQISLTAGHETVGRDVTGELTERGRATIARYLGRAVEKGRMTATERDAALDRLTLTTDVAELGECDLVIEAIVEELDAKRELFAELDRITRTDAVLATNTSALSVSEIAEATQHPERVVGMHFFNPAPVLPLV